MLCLQDSEIEDGFESPADLAEAEVPRGGLVGV